MNKWNCNFHGCESTAIGVGGAIGLVAIGWTFIGGKGPYGSPVLLCPQHKLTGTECNYNKELKDCRPCAAEKVANVFQVIISKKLEEEQRGNN